MVRSKRKNYDEAWKRFTSDRDMSEFQNVQQVLTSFSMWAKGNYVGSAKQDRFVLDYARREGIRGDVVRPETITKKSRTVTYHRIVRGETITITYKTKTHSIRVHRDLITGRFVRKTYQSGENITLKKDEEELKGNGNENE